MLTPFRISLTIPASSVSTKICPSDKVPVILYVPAEMTVALLPSTVTLSEFSVIEDPFSTISIISESSHV